MIHYRQEGNFTYESHHVCSTLIERKSETGSTCSIKGDSANEDLKLMFNYGFKVLYAVFGLLVCIACFCHLMLNNYILVMFHDSFLDHFLSYVKPEQSDERRCLSVVLEVKEGKTAPNLLINRRI